MELEENAAMYLVGDRYVNAWGQGDFVSTKQVKAIHKKSAAELKAAAEQADADDDEDEGDEEEGYGSWNVAQLKKELANREMSTAGNRKTLVARLEEADEAADEEDDVNEDDEEENEAD